ncbi:MAG: pyridoxamine 5'-phosphate oxidase family protein [Gammaproteobacteria bacterium]|nr:pyridoxamine 5'-phosphate oxidase family protein [Gammaproteobacteria bacterium]
MSEKYAVGQRNKARQLRDKARYDRDTVHAILDAAPVAHVGFIQYGQPVVVPMLHGRDGETVFLHGARKSRVVRYLEDTETACLNVTLVDGVVFARSAFNSSMHYRSATVFGSPRLLDSDAEKLHALRVISEANMPGRWDELRAPHDKEIRMTGVIALPIEAASAKIAGGMPGDEEEDYAIAVWAGVLPLESRFTTLQPDDRLIDGVEPSKAVRAMQRKTL